MHHLYTFTLQLQELRIIKKKKRVDILLDHFCCKEYCSMLFHVSLGFVFLHHQTCIYKAIGDHPSSVMSFNVENRGPQQGFHFPHSQPTNLHYSSISQYSQLTLLSGP